MQRNQLEKLQRGGIVRSWEVAVKPIQISVEKTVKLVKRNEVHYVWKVSPIKVKQSITDFKKLPNKGTRLTSRRNRWKPRQ
jgi:hypothetical protein